MSCIFCKKETLGNFSAFSGLKIGLQAVAPQDLTFVDSSDLETDSEIKAFNEAYRINTEINKEVFTIYADCSDIATLAEATCAITEEDEENGILYTNLELAGGWNIQQETKIKYCPFCGRHFGTKRGNAE